MVPHDKIQVTVEDGWVKLEGEVDWQYKKISAENAVKYMKGVKGVTNRIRVAPRVDPVNVKAMIEGAFKRHAQRDADKIRVEAIDGRVVLHGTVQSWRDRDDAERAAWSAPGVTSVTNDVAVSAR